MRFRDLPPGSAFRYQDQDYIKTSPLAATARTGGAQRLIARSAVVEPLDSPPAGARPAATDLLPGDAVRAALERLHDQAQRHLTAAGAATADREELSMLRDHLLRELGLRPQ